MMTPIPKSTSLDETKIPRSTNFQKCKFCDSPVGNGVVSTDWKCEHRSRVRVCDYHFDVISQILGGKTSWSIDTLIAEIRGMVN